MGDRLDQPVPTRSFRVLVYPSSMPVSNRALQVLADALRRHRTAMGSRWRRLPPGRQALLVLAHLRKGETYTLHWPTGSESAPPRCSATSATASTSSLRSHPR